MWLKVVTGSTSTPFRVWMSRRSGGPALGFSQGGPVRVGGIGGGGTGNEDGVGPKSVISLISCVGGCGTRDGRTAQPPTQTRPGDGSAATRRYTPGVT